MKNFLEYMGTNPPRMTVLYSGDGNNTEQFKWGVVGKLPTLTLVGFITRVQSELAFKAPPECGESALCIAWDVKEKIMEYWVDPIIPVDPLVGLLDAIKLKLITDQMMAGAQAAAGPQNSGIIGPDGRLIRRR